MNRDIIIFKNFLKQFGIYREFYRELRLAQPGFPRTSGGEIELPTNYSSKEYIICFLDWSRTRRGPYFWALMHDAWERYFVERH